MPVSNEKNRFSKLLEQLLTQANIKNITLAKELQYDESYISKWLNGKNLPPEKNAEKILWGISNCIVKMLDDTTSVLFLSQYQLQKTTDLNQAIYDNLLDEYLYVKNLRQETGAEIAPALSYYPELTLMQFIMKLHHPSLRQVNSLDVISVLDIFALDKEHRLLISMPYYEHAAGYFFPGVHFSCIIKLSDDPRTHTEDAVFLMNMLTNSNNIDYNLYSNDIAYGKLLFVVKNTFSLSGMLLDSHHCISVTINEEKENCNLIFNRIASLCTKESLLFRSTTITEMMQNHEYMQSLLTANLRYLIGHLTEHFLPDDLHEELIQQHFTDPAYMERLRTMHQITSRVLRTSPMRIIIYDSTLSQFSISGELDLYNFKVILSPEQRLRYMTHMLHLFTAQSNLKVKQVVGDFISSFHHIPKASLFLSNSFGYLRLVSQAPHNKIAILNKENVKTIFKNFFDDIWMKQNHHALKDESFLIQSIQDFMISIKILNEISN